VPGPNLAITSPRRSSIAAFVVFFVVLLSFGVPIVVSALTTPQRVVSSRVVTDTSTIPGPNPSANPVTTQHTVAVTTPAQSVIDRLMTAPVWLLLQIGVTVLGAFIAAGATQRVLLGRYGFSIGPLTVPEIGRTDVAAAGAGAIAGIEALLTPAWARAHAKAIDSAETNRRAGSQGATDALDAASDDSNLQLVALRLEIERRLKALAAAAGLDNPQAAPAARLLAELTTRDVLPQTVADALDDLLRLGTLAAHGRPVSADAGTWAANDGPRLLAALDALTSQVRTSGSTG